MNNFFQSRLISWEKVEHFRIPLSFEKIRFIFVLLVLTLFSLGILESYKEGAIVWKTARNETGELAWNLLVFILFLGLFSKIFPRAKLIQQFLPLRKEAGILVFLIVVVHAVFHFLRAGVLGNFEGMYFQAFERSWLILAGTMALIVMFPLFLTSNSFSVKKMGYKAWKRLQRLAHVVFILAAIHVSFVYFPEKGKIDYNALFLLGGYCIGYLYLFSRRLFSKK